MANNRRDDYPALTDPFGYAGEVELLEATHPAATFKGTNATRDGSNRR
jgi:hypothetical protein